MLREHLESYFAASLRDCYQVVKVLPPLDEVQVDQEKTRCDRPSRWPGKSTAHLCGLANLVGTAAIQDPNNPAEPVKVSVDTEALQRVLECQCKGGGGRWSDEVEELLVCPNSGKWWSGFCA